MQQLFIPRRDASPNVHAATLDDTLDAARTVHSSRLLIHLDKEPSFRGLHLQAISRRIVALCSIFRTCEKCKSLSLRLVDLEGKHIFFIGCARQLVDLSLPPGSYQITANYGETERVYALNLAPGTTFHLRLDPHLGHEDS